MKVVVNVSKSKDGSVFAQIDGIKQTFDNNSLSTQCALIAHDIIDHVMGVPYRFNWVEELTAAGVYHFSAKHINYSVNKPLDSLLAENYFQFAERILKSKNSNVLPDIEVDENYNQDLMFLFNKIDENFILKTDGMSEADKFKFDEYKSRMKKYVSRGFDIALSKYGTPEAIFVKRNDLKIAMLKFIKDKTKETDVCKKFSFSVDENAEISLVSANHEAELNLN